MVQAHGAARTRVRSTAAKLNSRKSREYISEARIEQSEQELERLRAAAKYA